VSLVLVLICWVQAKEDKAMVRLARLHAQSAQEAAIQAGSDEALMTRLKEVDARVTAAEAWAKACDDGEAALKRSREALAVGNRDEAAGHCRQARGLLDGGLKCESLAREVKDLEQDLNSGNVFFFIDPLPFANIFSIEVLLFKIGELSTDSSVAR
jgi:hypothetical protein